MSLLYECVNTVIAGKNHSYLVLKQMAVLSGRPYPTTTSWGLRWDKRVPILVMKPGTGWSLMAVPSPRQCIQGHLELQIPNLLHPITTCSQCCMFSPSLNHSQPHGKCHSQSPLPSLASSVQSCYFCPIHYSRTL